MNKEKNFNGFKKGLLKILPCGSIILDSPKGGKKLQFSIENIKTYINNKDRIKIVIDGAA